MLDVDSQTLASPSQSSWLVHFSDIKIIIIPQGHMRLYRERTLAYHNNYYLEISHINSVIVKFMSLIYISRSEFVLALGVPAQIVTLLVEWHGQ